MYKIFFNILRYLYLHSNNLFLKLKDVLTGLIKNKINFSTIPLQWLQKSDVI